MKSEPQGNLSHRGNLFLLVCVAVIFGDVLCASAQGRTLTVNTTRIDEAVNVLLLHIEGSFGALIMVASGMGAIMSCAFGNYRSALSLLVVAIGSFILRSLMGTFFNVANIKQ